MRNRRFAGLIGFLIFGLSDALATPFAVALKKWENGRNVTVDVLEASSGM